MRRQDARTLDRLVTLAAEAEHILIQGFSSHDIRNACAIARGYLELARSYGEPVNLEDVERVLDRMRAALAATKTKLKSASEAEWFEGRAT
jgi:signal transduction histidine kinase